MGIENGKLTAPLNTHSVARYIGANSLDAGTLCTSDLVNANAFYRPIGGTDTVQELSDDDRYNCDDGYNIEDAVCDTLNDAATKYDNGAYKWGVIDPTTFRLTDFIGYNRTARDFSPSKAQTLSLSGGLVEMSLDYFADIQEHVHKLSTIQGLSSFGYLGVHLGFIIWLKRESDYDYTKYLYTRGFYDEWKITQESIKLEKALTDYNGEAQQGKFEFKAMPVIFDNGKDTSSTSTPYTPDTLYDSTQLNGNLVSLNNATFKFVALAGKPIEGTFKTLMFEMADGISVVVNSLEGTDLRLALDSSVAKWVGNVVITNNNSYTVDVKVRMHAVKEISDNSSNGATTQSFDVIAEKTATLQADKDSRKYEATTDEWKITSTNMTLDITLSRTLTSGEVYQKTFSKEVPLRSSINVPGTDIIILNN